MKISPMVAEFFRAHRQTVGRTDMRSWKSPFAPTFSTIYDIALAAPNKCAGQENGNPQFSFILLLVSTLLLEYPNVSSCRKLFGICWLHRCDLWIYV